MKCLTPLIAMLACVCIAASSQADLIGYQSLDSPAGLTFGTPETGTNNAAIVAGGKFGLALSLDGAGDFASVDDVSGLIGKLGTGAKSVSIWYNQTTGTTGLRTPMTVGVNGTGPKFDIDIDNPNSGLEVGIGGGRTVDSGATLADGAWHHIVATHAASSNVQGISVYFDGVLRTNTTGQTTAINTSDTRWLFGTAANVGLTGPSIQFYNGLVDDGAIWDEQLTVEEIVALNFVGASSLGYSANLYDQMKIVHDAGSGSVTINGTNWAFATGIAGNTTSAVRFGSAGTGLIGTAIPEPTSLGLIASMACLIGLKRRRR